MIEFCLKDGVLILYEGEIPERAFPVKGSVTQEFWRDVEILVKDGEGSFPMESCKGGAITVTLTLAKGRASFKTDAFGGVSAKSRHDLYNAFGAFSNALWQVEHKTEVQKFLKEARAILPLLEERTGFKWKVCVSGRRVYLIGGVLHFVGRVGWGEWLMTNSQPVRDRVGDDLNRMAFLCNAREPTLAGIIERYDRFMDSLRIFGGAGS